MGVVFLALAIGGVACKAPDAGDLQCPEGAVAFRLTSADGREDWCRLDDGVAHGPYEKHDAADGLVVLGGFDNGLAQGDWQRFASPTYALVAEEAYDHALPHGRWALLEADGTVTSEHFWTYGAPCGRWSEFEDGVEVSHLDFASCDGVEPPPDPDTGPPLAVIGDFGWDGNTCPDGRRLVSSPPDDPTARYCVSDGDVRDGPFGRWVATSQVDAGTKAVGGQYTAGAPSGTWRAWYPSGSVSEEGQRDAAGKTGPWRFWRADRSLASAGAYAGDLQTGPWTFTWPHGTRQAEGSYLDGAEDGSWQTWYPTGIPEETVTWSAGVRDGAYARNHPSGVPAEEGQYLDDQVNGRWTTWYDNGILASRGDYLAGLRTGVWQTWDRAGLAASEGPFIAGVQHGTWSLWRWQQGERIKQTGDVIDGLPHGLWVAIHDPGGEAGGEVTYYLGSREGPSTTIWKSGTTQSEGSYLADQPHGVWRFYYPDGQLFIDCSFGFGEYDGDYREFYPDGAPKAEGVYESGYKTGLWTYWDETGAMHTEGTDQ